MIRLLAILVLVWSLVSPLRSQIYLSFQSQNLVVVENIAGWDDAHGRLRVEQTSTENFGLQGDIAYGYHGVGNGLGLGSAAFAIKLDDQPIKLEGNIQIGWYGVYPNLSYYADFFGTRRNWPNNIASSWISFARNGYLESKITGTSDVGQVGYSIDEVGSISSFILNNGNFEEFSIFGLPTMITGIYQNKVVGNFIEPNATFGTLTKTFIASIPEPSSLSLLALGGVVVALGRWKR